MSGRLRAGGGGPRQWLIKPGHTRRAAGGWMPTRRQWRPPQLAPTPPHTHTIHRHRHRVISPSQPTRRRQARACSGCRNRRPPPRGIAGGAGCPPPHSQPTPAPCPPACCSQAGAAQRSRLAACSAARERLALLWGALHARAAATCSRHPWLRFTHRLGAAACSCHAPHACVHRKGPVADDGVCGDLAGDVDEHHSGQQQVEGHAAQRPPHLHVHRPLLGTRAGGQAGLRSFMSMHCHISRPECP